MRQKSSDFSCIPLCHLHHTAGPHSYHSYGRERDFEEYWGIDLHQLATELYAIWTAKDQREEGWFLRLLSRCRPVKTF